MAKALKVVGIVVAVVAIAATAVATFGASLGVMAGMTVATAATVAATAATVAAYASLAAGVLAIAGTFIKPGFQGGGNPLNFSTNPQSGLPYGIGRSRMSGLRIHADTYSGTKAGSKQDILAFAVLLSAGGAIDAIESFRADKVAITFNGTTGAAIGTYADYMARKVSLGGPTALSLSFQGGNFPGWTSDHKLTGMAHALWDLRYDKDGDFYTAGVPEPEWVGRWNKVYDPRLDSTYPGGSGAHRALNESTYAWSSNPALHALTWALGRWQNGKRTLGIGAPVPNIRVAEFVEAANVADANGWYCGGFEWSTDSKWAVLKRMLQAGGAIPTQTGAMIGCRVKAPRVSITTVEAKNLLDTLSISVTAPRRERINSLIPRYRSENHEWEIISGTPVTVAAYVTADGGLRRREIDLPLVQHEAAFGNGNVQAGQLAAYEIVDAREGGPIRFTVGPQFIGIKSGDCVTLNVPDEGLNAQDIIITERSFDPATGKITFSAMTETISKHAYALGQSTTPPPTFALSPPDLLPPMPNAGLWGISASSMSDGLPAITVTGASEYPSATDVVIRYRVASGAWFAPIVIADDQGTITYQIGPLDGLTSYEVEIAYRNDVGQGPWLSLGTVATIGAPLSTEQFPTAPPSDWAVGSIYIDANKRQYRFVGTETVSNGDAVTSNAAAVTSSGYVDIQDTGILAAQASAAAAQAAATIASGLANDAQATADGKVQTYYQTSAPTAEGVGDLWFDTDAGNKQYRWSGSAWIAVQDGGIGQAISDAAGAQATADGKVTTFISESSPTAEGVGDLWFKASTGELRRWSGSAWGDPLVDLTAAKTPDLTGNLSWAISGDVAGTVITALPVDRRFVAMLGTNNVSPDTAFVLLNVTSGIALTVNNTAASADRGVVTLGTGTTGSGTATLKATLPGGAIVERVIAVTKTNAIPATGGGSGATFAQDTTFTTITGTSHAAISDELICRSDGANKVRIAVDLIYTAVTGSTIRIPSFKASYATSAGGSLTDLFAEEAGSFCQGGTEPETGWYTRAEVQFTLPAPSTDYYFKLQGRRSSGTGNISFDGNSFTVRQ